MISRIAWIHILSKQIFLFKRIINVVSRFLKYWMLKRKEKEKLSDISYSEWRYILFKDFDEIFYTSCERLNIFCKSFSSSDIKPVSDSALKNKNENWNLTNQDKGILAPKFVPISASFARQAYKIIFLHNSQSVFRFS